MSEESVLDADTITVSLGKHDGQDVLIVDDKNGANDLKKKTNVKQKSLGAWTTPGSTNCGFAPKTVMYMKPPLGQTLFHPRTPASLASG